MKIAELRPRQSNVEIEATIIEIGETREFDRFDRLIRVATAKIKDDSGSIALSLWNKDIEKVKVGDKIKITNGFVKEFQGQPQLTTGKLGKLEVVESEDKEEQEEKAEEPEEEAEEEETEEEEEAAEE